MIQIKLVNIDFEYDIQSLTKAFFPKEEVTFETQEIATQVLEVSYEQRQIGISFIKDGIPILTKTDMVPIEERKVKKNVLKRLLYHVLMEVTGRTLQWGTLTGIRPTKLAMEKLENGENLRQIEQFMYEQYLCSKEKTDLCMDIVTREHAILEEIDYKNGYSIYIGIPFCPSTCLYCSFASYSVQKFAHLVDDYLDALCKEIAYAKNACPSKRLTTVYLGGGTPTTLNEQQLERLLKRIKEEFDFTYVREFTVEAGRPDSITREKLRILKKYGVSRISINPQTMKQETLDLIGRKHTVEQIRDTFVMAREEGHENINMDIIIGIPGECPDDVAETLRQIDQLSPDSLTVHTLAIKRAANLNIYKEKYQGLVAKDVVGMLQLCFDYTKKAQYHPYYLYRQKNMAENLENIGYAKDGKEGIYNILIMEEKQTILALGAGASSKFVFPDGYRIERAENVKSVTDYIARVDEMIARKEKVLSDNADELR
ncbi:coproporphyrinogen dehydrogenase HemZ [Anaerosporobacter faecicola]|uniref:coproporphyrinogen dehydrogenase HemZ n=1 Tax=Anaerosporobacter faecicola TaxID=2718714 RepID=UPI0014393182|nr:coproporphyrinogen dehydrogenase HemZ [Anaerosporobacter faecicola]